MRPLRKPDIHDPGSSGSSCDETFILLFVFFFIIIILFSLLLPCYLTLQMSFVAVDPVIVVARNKAYCAINLLVFLVSPIMFFSRLRIRIIISFLYSNAIINVLI